MLSGVCCREKEMKQTIAQLNEELEGQKAATQKTVQVGFVAHTDAAHCRRRGTSLVQGAVGVGEGLGFTLV